MQAVHLVMTVYEALMQMTMYALLVLSTAGAGRMIMCMLASIVQLGQAGIHLLVTVFHVCHGPIWSAATIDSENDTANGQGDGAKSSTSASPQRTQPATFVPKLRSSPTRNRRLRRHRRKLRARLARRDAARATQAARGSRRSGSARAGSDTTVSSQTAVSCAAGAAPASAAVGVLVTRSSARRRKHAKRSRRAAQKQHREARKLTKRRDNIRAQRKTATRARKAVRNHHSAPPYQEIPSPTRGSRASTSGHGRNQPQRMPIRSGANGRQYERQQQKQQPLQKPGCLLQEATLMAATAGRLTDAGMALPASSCAADWDGLVSNLVFPSAEAVLEELMTEWWLPTWAARALAMPLASHTPQYPCVQRDDVSTADDGCVQHSTKRKHGGKRSRNSMSSRRKRRGKRSTAKNAVRRGRRSYTSPRTSSSRRARSFKSAHNQCTDDAAKVSAASHVRTRSDLPRSPCDASFPKTSASSGPSPIGPMSDTVLPTSTWPRTARPQQPQSSQRGMRPTAQHSGASAAAEPSAKEGLRYDSSNRSNQKKTTPSAHALAQCATGRVDFVEAGSDSNNCMLLATVLGAWPAFPSLVRTRHSTGSIRLPHADEGAAGIFVTQASLNATARALRSELIDAVRDTRQWAGIGFCSNYPVARIQSELLSSHACDYARSFGPSLDGRTTIQQSELGDFAEAFAVGLEAEQELGNFELSLLSTMLRDQQRAAARSRGAVALCPCEAGSWRNPQVPAAVLSKLAQQGVASAMHVTIIAVADRHYKCVVLPAERQSSVSVVGTTAQAEQSQIRGRGGGSQSNAAPAAHADAAAPAAPQEVVDEYAADARLNHGLLRSDLGAQGAGQAQREVAQSVPDREQPKRSRASGGSATSHGSTQQPPHKAAATGEGIALQVSTLVSTSV